MLSRKQKAELTALEVVATYIATKKNIEDAGAALEYALTMKLEQTISIGIATNSEYAVLKIKVGEMLAPTLAISYNASNVEHLAEWLEKYFFAEEEIEITAEEEIEITAEEII